MTNYIVTGARMTGSKHFVSLRGALEYASFLLRGEMAVRITLKQESRGRRLPPQSRPKRRGKVP